LAHSLLICLSVCLLFLPRPRAYFCVTSKAFTFLLLEAFRSSEVSLLPTRSQSNLPQILNAEQTDKVEECRDLSKLIRNPFAVIGSGVSPFRPNASNSSNTSSLLGNPSRLQDADADVIGLCQNNAVNGFQGHGPRPSGSTNNIRPSLLQNNQNNPSFPRRGPPSPVERVSRQVSLIFYLKSHSHLKINYLATYLKAVASFKFLTAEKHFIGLWQR
jgi:hypothetical protein